jgi:hypothetical protein
VYALSRPVGVSFRAPVRVPAVHTPRLPARPRRAALPSCRTLSQTLTAEGAWWGPGGRSANRVSFGTVPGPGPSATVAPNKLGLTAYAG